MNRTIILEPYKGMNTRYHCPSCNNREKTFSRYIYFDTGEYVHYTVGKCNRILKCGYHYTPKQYFEDNKIYLNSSVSVSTPYKEKRKQETTDLNYYSKISVEVFRNHLKNYSDNNLIKFLNKRFDYETINSTVSKYFIGTSGYWPGATIFFLIDISGNIHAGKIMLYHSQTGKRVREPHDHITWLHSVMKLSEYNLNQCFFGEHLLKNNHKPVGIVESEKTAVIASIYFPNYVWLAAGNANGLNENKCSVLKGKSVVLFPDLKCLSKWTAKAQELSHITNIRVSQLLETRATEREKVQGLDLADYLLRFSISEFNRQANLQTEEDELMKRFDTWIKSNPEGGIFEYDGERVMIRPKNISASHPQFYPHE